MFMDSDFLYFPPKAPWFYPPSYPPVLSLLQSSTLGLDWVVDDTAGTSREVHGNQGILRYTPLLGETWRGGRVGGGGRQGSEVKQARHSHWGMTNPVCTQTHFSLFPGLSAHAQINDVRELLFENKVNETTGLNFQHNLHDIQHVILVMMMTGCVTMAGCDIM